MTFTEPIRNLEELKDFIDYYKVQHYNPRNYCLIATGLNTALRISDILSLRWEDVFDFEKKEMKKHIVILESKTSKSQSVLINSTLSNAFLSLKSYLDTVEPHQYIFKSNGKISPITRIQAYRIVKKAADNTLSDSSHISCHSLRKTFGYFAYKNGTSPVLLMSIFNHSSFDITKRYLGINQDEKDSVYLSVHF